MIQLDSSLFKNSGQKSKRDTNLIDLECYLSVSNSSNLTLAQKPQGVRKDDEVFITTMTDDVQCQADGIELSSKAHSEQFCTTSAKPH